VRIDGLALLTLGIETDLNPGVAAELPSAVSAALAGQPLPLERLAALTNIANASGVFGINLAVEVATTCADGPFPWPTTTPVADRAAILDSALLALTPAATAPFGRWAALISNAAACKSWPAPSSGTVVERGALPNVPVLILAGSRDTRTPQIDARALARQFPKSRLLIVNGAGHSLFTSSVCAVTYAVAFLAGKEHGPCPRQVPMLAPLGPFATTSSSATGSLTPAQTFFAAKFTLQEAEASWLVTQGTDRKLHGLLGGTLTPIPPDDLAASSFKFTGYSAVAGVRLTGTISYRSLASARWSGYVAVNGPRAAQGRLSVDDGRLTGDLGGKHVSGRTAPS
jgi:hypothetical protein